MNERIQELAEQASAWDYYDIDDSFDCKMLHKFAELIVRECIAECWYDATPKQISDNIKMKFGVE